ncbi:MAG: DUF1398 family protein [Streptococcaceae bacterium]|jgi:uncharacterized protein YbcV (DUF1398 family)|nr:DUF1398 family protein [Streptococcaceae bacterium]
MTTIQKLQAAFQKTEQIRPKVGGFPVLAAVLKEAGAKKNIWQLPSGQSIFIMNDGNSVVIQNEPLIKGMKDVPIYNEENFLKILRADQNGETTFPEFLMNTWLSGVIRYTVDFDNHLVTYYGVNGEEYSENYPEVEI